MRLLSGAKQMKLCKVHKKSFEICSCLLTLIGWAVLL